MSNIAYSTINEGFPVAGQDNDSQGFRNNFALIKSGLAVAHDEITTLQNNTIDITQETSNINGTTLTNGFSQLTGVYYSATSNSGENGMFDINVTQGAMQRIVLSGDMIINFTSWPVSGDAYSVMRLMVRGASASHEITDFTTENGNIKLAVGLTVPITVASTHYTLIEVWSVDGGTNVQVRVLGEF